MIKAYKTKNGESYILTSLSGKKAIFTTQENFEKRISDSRKYWTLNDCDSVENWESFLENNNW